MSQGTNNGWIKLHRSMLENRIITKDPERVAIWIYLLLSANHQEKEIEFEGKKITLLPGQLVTGRRKIAAETGVSESKTERVLKCFEIEQQIEQQKTRHNRLITILKWEQYQQSEPQNEQQMNNNWTTSEQQVNTNKNVRMKECKNIYIYNVQFDGIWNEYKRKDGKQKAFRMYQARLNEGYSEEELLQAVRAYMDECDKNNTEKRYIKLLSTFFGIDKPFVDYLSKGGAVNGSKSEPAAGSPEWMEQRKEQLDEVRKHMSDL